MRIFLILVIFLLPTLSTASEKTLKRAIASEDEAKIISYLENRITDIQIQYRQMDFNSQLEFRPVLSKSIEVLSLLKASFFQGKIDESISCFPESKEASNAYYFVIKVTNMQKTKGLSDSEIKSLKILLDDSEKLLESKNAKQLSCIKKVISAEKSNSKININDLKSEFNSLKN